MSTQIVPPSPAAVPEMPLQESVVSPAATPPARPRRVKKQPLYLQHEELDRLFRVIHSVRDRALFRVAYHAGLRASEVGLLELRDVDLHNESIYIHRLKGSHSGVHFLVREESRALRAWLKVRGELPGPLFPTRLRTPIARGRTLEMMHQYGAAAGLAPKLCHFHVLKHTCATDLIERGFSIELVQNWLGHANIQSTLIYTHITSPSRQRMAAELRETWR